MTEDHPNEYRVETGSASSLDIEVLEADLVLRGTGTDTLVASLTPGGHERGQPVGLDVHQEGDTVFIRGIDDLKLSRQTLTVEVPPALRAVRARTGKGDLSVSRLAEVELDLHTGKGDAELTELSRRIHLDTGHGDIEARALVGRIELSTGSGDVEISEASGDWIRLHTGHGDIAIERVTGNTLCKLGQGDVATRNLGGDVEITTGEGDIVLSAQDNLKAHVRTGAGDILVHKGSLRKLNVHTGSGDITLQADLLEGQFDLASSKGDLRVVLQPDANVRFEAATARGDLVSDVPGVKVGRPGPASRAGGRLVGVLGDGRAALSLRTGKGDVTIRFPREYQGEMGSMRAKASREMRHNWQTQREAIRAEVESFRAALETARGAVFATKEPLREALSATREVIETSLHQGTASILRATEEALRTTTSALHGIEEALQDLCLGTDGGDEDLTDQETSPMSSAAEAGTGSGPEGAEQLPTGDNGSPSPVEEGPGVGALEETLQAARNTIISSLNQLRESATHAWEEALRAVEIRSHGQERGEEVSPSQPTDTEEVAIPETAGESATSDGQVAPAEESTAMRVLEALQAGEIDVGEADRLLSGSGSGERGSPA